jgi:hypothetical protein
MPKEVHLWRIESGQRLTDVPSGELDLEERLETWLTRDISVLDPRMLVIGRQVPTEGGPLDLLCIDEQGDLVIVELKRGKTHREITAQVLDYASTVAELTNEQVRAIAKEFLSVSLDDAFVGRFGSDVPETLNGDHRILVVGSAIDAASERIIKYLSDAHGMNINAATFQYLRLADGTELLSRVFFIEPSEVDVKVRTKGTSKRRPNLTFDELDMLAEQAGVSDLYSYAVSLLGPPMLRKSTTLSSVSLDAHLSGSRKVVLSFIPGDSTAERGLHFQLYQTRYAELAKLPVEEVEALMPPDHKPWEFFALGGPDYEGFEGSIRTEQEIDRIAEPIRSAESSRSGVSCLTVPFRSCSLASLGQHRGRKISGGVCHALRRANRISACLRQDNPSAFSARIALYNAVTAYLAIGSSTSGTYRRIERNAHR